MTTGGYREEVFNVLLALLLHEQGIITAPEQAFRQAIHSRRQVPDVLVTYRGLRTVIEGKVDDQPGAKDEGLKAAQERVNRGIAHIGVAVVYPAGLRQKPFADLSEALEQATFSIAVCSEAGQMGWTEGNLDYLADVLRKTYHQLVEEDVVKKATDILDAGVGEFARLAFTTTVMVQRAAQILGIGEPPRRKRKEPEDEEE